MNVTLLKLGTAVGLTAATVLGAGGAQAMTVKGSGGSIPSVDTGGTGTPGDIFQSSVNVADSLIITEISVLLNDFRHTWIGDLNASLTHENSGTSVTLFDRPGKLTEDEFDFGDDSDFDGDYSFVNGLAPIPEFIDPNILAPGSYGPKNSFDAFVGINSFGTWTLSIADFAVEDSGSLESWQLNIEGTDAVPTPALLPGLVGMGMAAWRKRRQQALLDQ